jgi:hypothetical protein
MPITTNVPLPAQSLATSQPLIQGNFVTIQDAFVQDHVDYNTSGQGKHNQVTFPNFTGSIAFLSGEIGLFNQTAAPTNVPDIWLQRGTGTPYPMTGCSVGSPGWSYLPSGMLTQWGNSTVNSNSTTTISFPIAYSNPGAPFTIQLTQYTQSSPVAPTITLGNFTTGTFVVNNVGPLARFYWYAVGI